MNFDYIRRYYKLPFLRRGGRIRYKGETGKVTGTHNASLLVRFERAEGMRRPLILHPTWNIAYLDTDGNIQAEFGE